MGGSFTSEKIEKATNETNAIRAQCLFVDLHDL